MILARRCFFAWLGVILLGLPAAAAEEPALNVYNWSDYIARDTIAEFEKETGIKVAYDTFDAETTVEAKVLSGGARYDIVVTQAPFFGRQIKAGVYLALDKSKLPNWKNLNPHVLQAVAEFDPGNAHAVPYLRSTNGFTYNVTMIKARMPDAPVDSLAMIFDPAVVSKFADCGVSFLDSANDVLQLALAYLHLDPNTTRPEDYKQAEALVMAVRPYIRLFDSTEFLNALPNQERCIAMSWSVDYVTARERAKAAGVTLDLAFTLPKEGAALSDDAMLVPASAPHPDNAHKFLDYIMRPKVIAQITNETHYGNANLAANAYVDPSLLNNPVVYLTPEIEARLYSSRPVGPDIDRLRTRIWTRIKTGR